MYSRIIKPIFDFIFALLGLLILSPLFLIVMIGLFFANNGKPFFYQKRPGKGERIFTIVKFKTMNDKRDAQGNLLPDHARLTKIGRFVRGTSLDEIPQLLNVLKGDMSFVGPRPLLPEYLELYSPQQAKRHDVKPGITGWAQVNGRNAISWERKLELDSWYVEKQSFQLDIKILFLTAKKVLVREGINMEGEATTSPFKGNY
ncbi:sugar transferase [Aequorivita echinoideorum]|uniref:Sugar transferase n=1 Tax=Aequorivita echinoideorum TaxID=1549647 RepID=A0ABS5S3Y8_9FLAO|nr:sugar transferase [Aequorivita echinoideorum]MBT0607925.1 sugar transferase [Aequorivita echinoideorum]